MAKRYRVRLTAEEREALGGMISRGKADARKLAHQRDYPDREAAQRDLFAYIEGYYNRQRIHSAIGYSPRRRQTGKPHNRCPLFRGKVTGSTPTPADAAAIAGQLDHGRSQPRVARLG